MESGSSPSKPAKHAGLKKEMTYRCRLPRLELADGDVPDVSSRLQGVPGRNTLSQGDDCSGENSIHPCPYGSGTQITGRRTLQKTRHVCHRSDSCSRIPICRGNDGQYICRGSCRCRNLLQPIRQDSRIQQQNRTNEQDNRIQQQNRI